MLAPEELITEYDAIFVFQCHSIRLTQLSSMAFRAFIIELLLQKVVDFELLFKYLYSKTNKKPLLLLILSCIQVINNWYYLFLGESSLGESSLEFFRRDYCISVLYAGFSSISVNIFS